MMVHQMSLADPRVAMDADVDDVNAGDEEVEHVDRDNCCCRRRLRQPSSVVDRSMRLAEVLE
jgi:hypothetical protein